MELKEVLQNTNIWWEKKDNINHFVEALERPELENVASELDFQRITVLIGPRRTGKTTLLFQSIKRLIDKGTDPKNILFLSLDNSTFRFLSANILEDVFRVYFEEILFEKPSALRNKVYIFLDEVQKEENWAEWIKNKYDLFKELKFVVSGSSSTKIARKTRETLVGRTSTLFLFPLTFQQFLCFYGIALDFHFHEDITMKEIVQWHESIKKDELLIKKLLQEYFLVGGFIEWFKVKDVYRWNKYLQEDIIEKLFLGDILSEYDIKDKEGLRRILLVLAKSQGNLFSLHSLSKEALVGKDAIENYVSLLKDGFVIYVLENYSKHIGVVLRKNKKINLIDIGLVNSIKRNHELSKTEFGKFLEQTVQQHLYYFSQIHCFSAYFYRDTEGQEIDAVLETGKAVLPIEIKAGDAGSIKHLEFFMSKWKCKRGILLTENLLQEEEKILKIPYWLFLASV